jgi:PRC-barrel domain
MRRDGRAAALAFVALSVAVRFSTPAAIAEALPQTTPSTATPATPPTATPAQPLGDVTGQPPGDVTPPSVVVLATGEVQGVLGREVRSAADENMGRVVDVLVDPAGQMRAAVIDFGGFLGVGSRKIAVDWNALHFAPTASESDRIILELTRDQVKTAPEYKDGKPVVVLGPSGNSEPLQLSKPGTPEK